MYNEERPVFMTLRKVGRYFERIALVQSQLIPYEIFEKGKSVLPIEYILFPNLDTRTDEQKNTNSERFDFLNRSMARNFSAAFQHLEQFDLDYVVAITGDTCILYMDGILDLIDKMGDAPVACSRAIGQQFHASHWTREQMADPNCPKEGRLQDSSNKDFMPQFWIVPKRMIQRFAHIEVTNPWCFEQCLGDVLDDQPYVFSDVAYDFSDGIVYNTEFIPNGLQTTEPVVRVL